MTDARIPPRRRVTFQGASDDCIEIAGCPGADEFYADANGTGLFKLSSAEEATSLLVRVTYEKQGVWSVALMPLDEGVPVPSWSISLAPPMNDYTICVAVDGPDDVTLSRQDADDG